MHVRLSPLVKWPSREELIKTMPMKFRKNSNSSINLIMCTPQEDISVLDKVVTVCCALCNCCDYVASME